LTYGGRRMWLTDTPMLEIYGRKNLTQNVQVTALSLVVGTSMF